MCAHPLTIPIIVNPRVDCDGDEYLHAYIVFDRDQALLACVAPSTSPAGKQTGP